MYGKIFESMYDGTISVNWKALVTFQQMIVLCDSDGILDMTPPAISRRTNIPLDIIEEGIEFLQKPDPYSRSKAEEGRRIVLIDADRSWGWRIVNHKYYRDLASREDKKEKDRLRIAEKRNKINNVASCSDVSQMSPIQDTDTNTNKTLKHTSNASRIDIPYESITNLYHDILPQNPRIAKLSPARKAQIRARWLNGIGDIEAWERYFNIVAGSKFLTGQVPPSRDRSKPFIADIDFLIKEANVLKIVEGKYSE